MWERACSRWRHHIQHRCKLTHRYREQARSHRVGVMLKSGTRRPVHPTPTRPGGRWRWPRGCRNR
ncbi:hypothetical protein CF597_25505 [Pseudomonas sp. PSB1]|nr:hypothetical protein [Pseudomonas sp. PSB1]